MVYVFRNSNNYRKDTPKGSCDLLIVSLIHQKSDMVYYMAKNIQKYVKGSFVWIAHYNNDDPIDETKLPSWAWLVRDTNVTLPYHYHRLRLFGINKALSFAIQSGLHFTNVMTFSSGSAFYKEFQVPTKPRVCLDSHEKIFDPTAKLQHVEEISVKYSGECGKYLQSIGSFPWQYLHGDEDVELQMLIQKRNFKWFRGNQWSGQIWPYEVAVMLAEDIATLYDSPNTPYLDYVCEEIYLSTYAYNYAKEHSITIEHSEVIINWQTNYNIQNPQYIDYLRKNPSFQGHAVCKLSDDIRDPVRRYIEESMTYK